MHKHKKSKKIIFGGIEEIWARHNKNLQIKIKFFLRSDVGKYSKAEGYFLSLAKAIPKAIPNQSI